MTSDLEQGTQEWRDARVAHVTASRICDVLAKPRKGQRESTTRRNYIAQVACEILTGKSAEREFQSWDTKRGIELEPLARAEYEIRQNVTVRKVGFIEHPRIARLGCSPDGLVGDEGLVQFKCPIPAIHFDYIECAKRGQVPPEYVPQVQCELACHPSRKWSDFVSYNDQMPDHLQLVVIRSERDEAFIAEMEREVLAFLAEVEAQIDKLPQPGEKFAGMVETLESSIARAQQ